MLIAARDNGFRVKQQERIVLDTVGQYRAAMASFAGMSNLDVWYAHIEIERVLRERASGAQAANGQRGRRRPSPRLRTKDSMAAFSKLTHVVDGEVRIVDQSPLIVPIEQLAPAGERDRMFDLLRGLTRTYRETLEFDRRVLLQQFRLTDFARKVVGVGSVGTRAWIALSLGRDGDDPLFLQLRRRRRRCSKRWRGRAGSQITGSESSPGSG